MNRVLYEASFEFDPFHLGPIFIMIFVVIFIAVFPFILKHKLNNNKNHYNYKSIKSLYIAGFGFFATFSLGVLLGQIDMYNKIVKAYEQGNYQIVEGYIENFDPMPYGGHKEESFDINGVHFSYSDFSVQPGYHNAKSHGGVITGNGQHLKIGYVYYNSAEGNIIVYIEKID